MDPFQLDPERCYRAIDGRDPKFDGRFFVGVQTTGIFCRSVCPAPTPKASNCTYWPSAAAAQQAGFRPCLRCRPEAAPGTPAWQGTAATVSRALRLIESGALDGDGSVDDLATRLGMGSRHLRRLFDQHLGATPKAVAMMRRTLFAKQLIDETTLRMTDVALSAGFTSQRRFNTCVREVYGRSPSELRKSRRAVGRAAEGPREAESVRLSLSYRPPFDWDALLGFFGARAIPGVEDVTEEGAYVRTLRTPGGAASVSVTHDAKRQRLNVWVRSDSSAGLIEIASRLRQLFDLDADAESIDALLGAQRLFRQHVAQHPGVRVPGAFDGFETAVRAILGQQISVQGASTLAGRIVEAYGTRIPRRLALHPSLSRLFPEPKKLVKAELEGLGIISSRAETIRNLARTVRADPDLLTPGASPTSDLDRWTALKGIGPWTGHYVAMRVLREPDALPAGDLVLRKSLTPKDAPPIAEKRVEERLEACRPYRAYAAIRLWSMASGGG